MNNKQRKSLLSLALALSLGSTIISGSAYAANTGGKMDGNNYKGTVDGTDTGAIATSDAKVTIDTDVTGNVYGGYAADTTEVKNNTVTVTGGTVAIVFGGESKSGNATGNRITVSGGTVRQVFGGASELGAVTGNNITISGGTVLVVFGASSKSGDATGNNVTISGGTGIGVVLGAQARSATVSGNSVNISGGTFDPSTQIHGGYIHQTGTVSSNSVNISGGTFDPSTEICGGYNAETGTVTGNSVSINGGTFDPSTKIYGGYSAETGTVTGNSVNINGGTFDPSTEIYGGYSKTGTVSGNTLNWGHKASIKSVANFANYNFIIPAGSVDGDTLLTITGNDTTDLTKSVVKLVGVQGTRKWAVGEKVILMDAVNSTIDGVDNKLEDKFIKGIKKYKYEIEKIDSDKKLQATITGTGVIEQAKSLSEGRIAAIGFINSAADLASGAALNNAMSSGSKYDLFGAMNYSDSKYKSGSHADVKGSSFLLGFARNIQGNKNKWTLGAFLESGNSSYETFNSFADAGDVHANGKNNYVGGGIMARNSQDSGMYYEGSLRFGRMSSDYNSTDIDTKYDIKSTYYGAHLGLGKIFKINKSNDIDVYGKYFWSHQNSATASIDGEAFNFDSINSNRLRIGARLNMLGGGHGIKTYVGLAYEHEFSGSARASYSGESIAAPSIKGATGVGEIGMVYKPSGKSAFSMDVGLNGYVGKRQGIGGGIKLNWGF